MLGYEDGEIGEKPEEWFDRIHDADRERVKEEIAAHQKGLTSHFESEHRMLHREGGFRWMLSRGVAVRDASGKVLRMAGSQTDITEGKVSDPLTGLPNTRFMFMHLTRELARAERLKSEVSLLVMDLDSFKDINDTYGHHVGDRALREVAAVLRAAIRPYDICVRYAGDEFIAVLSGCGRAEAERRRCRRGTSAAVAQMIQSVLQ